MVSNMARTRAVFSAPVGSDGPPGSGAGGGEAGGGGGGLGVRSAVVAIDHLGDAGRFRRIAHLHDHVVRHLHAALDVLDTGDRHAHAQVGANGDGRGEADLVGAIVHAELRVVDADDLVEQHRCQRQREIPVRDGDAEGAGLGPLGVDVDPLVVVGGVGEEVDPLLCDGLPFGVAEVLADELVEGVDAVDDGLHAVLLADQGLRSAQDAIGRGALTTLARCLSPTSTTTFRPITTGTSVEAVPGLRSSASATGWSRTCRWCSGWPAPARGRPSCAWPVWPAWWRGRSPWRPASTSPCGRSASSWSGSSRWNVRR